MYRKRGLAVAGPLFYFCEEDEAALVSGPSQVRRLPWYVSPPAPLYFFEQK